MSNTMIIGIDHGYKNMKGANSMFATRLSKLEGKPDQMDGILAFQGNYYTIQGKELSAVNNHIKSDSYEYYLLTLAVIGMEFEKRGVMPGANRIHVRLGCGLPQKWYDRQKDSFKQMRLKNRELSFGFNGKSYNIAIDNVSVFMQGFAALPVLNLAIDKKGYVVLVDIGGETVDLMISENYKLMYEECKLDRHATISLLKEINSELESELGESIPESSIISYLASKTKADTPKNKYEEIMQKCLIRYADYIMTKLKEWGINTNFSDIVFLGGGGRIIKAFGTYEDNIHFCDDMKINAKGYEYFETIMSRRTARG